ncbi:hypothetical protein SCA6_014236 [Theobroma cacao]
MSEIHLCSFGFGKDLINAFANMQNLCIHMVLSQIEKGKGLWKTVPFIVYCVSVKSYHAHHHFSYLLPLGPKVKAVASVMQQALVWSLGFD